VKVSTRSVQGHGKVKGRSRPGQVQCQATLLQNQVKVCSTSIQGHVNVGLISNHGKIKFKIRSKSDQGQVKVRLRQRQGPGPSQIQGPNQVKVR